MAILNRKVYRIMHPDSKSEEELINQNMGLIISRAKMFKPFNSDMLDEYIQIGRIGLLKAIRTHDPNKGSLSTLAWNHIGWEIMRELNKKKREVPTEKLLRDYAHYTPKAPLWEILPDTLSEKELRVIEYRQQGLTFKEIGYELGDFTRGWAQKLFKSAVEKIREANEEKTHTDV